MAKKRGKGEGSIKRIKSGQWRGLLMDGYTDDPETWLVFLHRRKQRSCSKSANTG